LHIIWSLQFTPVRFDSFIASCSWAWRWSIKCSSLVGKVMGLSIS